MSHPRAQPLTSVTVAVAVVLDGGGAARGSRVCTLGLALRQGPEAVGVALAAAVGEALALADLVVVEVALMACTTRARDGGEVTHR